MTPLRATPTWLLALALLVAVAAATGCGYQHQELFPQDIRTVAVPIAENRNPQFYRDVEFELTEALIKEIELRTPYKVVRGEVADTRLAVTVVEVEQSLVSRRRPSGLPQEMEVTVAVDFEWKNLRSPQQVIRDGKGFAAVGRYIPTSGVGEPFEIARRAAVANLARDLVDQMRADW